jgi:hypothetical protein
MTKKKKHAKHMTTDEAVKHLFHPHVVKHAQEQLEKRATRKKTDDKRNQNNG